MERGVVFPDMILLSLVGVRFSHLEVGRVAGPGGGEDEELKVHHAVLFLEGEIAALARLLMRG